MKKTTTKKPTYRKASPSEMKKAFAMSKEITTICIGSGLHPSLVLGVLEVAVGTLKVAMVKTGIFEATETLLPKKQGAKKK